MSRLARTPPADTSRSIDLGDMRAFLPARDSTNARPESQSDDESDIPWSRTSYSGSYVGSDEEEESTTANRGAGRRSSVATLRDSRGFEVILFESATTTSRWQEYASILERESPTFSSMFKYGKNYYHEDGGRDPAEDLRGIERIPGAQNAFKLVDVSDSDFESFLSGVRPKLGCALALHELCPLLVLATDWGFDHFRRYAIDEIPKHHMESIAKIKLARRTNVPKWLQEEYIHLSTQLKFLSSSDVAVLGQYGVSAIGRARAAVLARRMKITRGDTPPTWMGGAWNHSGCWKVLVEAWDDTLLVSKVAWWGDMSPAEALQEKLRSWKLQADQNPDDKTAKKLCKSCQPQEAALVEWVGSDKDHAIAVAELNAALGTDISAWIGKV